jgi:hypothetical protein
MFSWMFELIAANSLEIDEQHINAFTKGSTDASAIESARETYLFYCSDMVWRVGLLSSLPFSALAIALLVDQIWPEFSGWMTLFIIFLIFGMFGFFVAKRSPFKLQRPIIRWLSSLTYYRFGTFLLTVLNVGTLLLTFYRFIQKTP